VEAQAIGFIERSDHRRRIATHLRTTRDLGDELAIRSAEAKLAIRLSLEVITVLVDGTMVAPTE